LASRQQVPTFRTRASRWPHAAFMPVAARTVGRHPPSFLPDQRLEPGFGDIPTLSTGHQRFTCVRLASAHLTGSGPAFSATLATPAIVPAQLAVVRPLILQSESEGPTLISCAARLHPSWLYITASSSRRRGAQSSAYRQKQCPRRLSSLSRSSSTILLRRGEALNRCAIVRCEARPANWRAW